MSLTLYFHPLSSYCQKALIALYEQGIAFTPRIVDLGDAADHAAFLKVWPIGKFPVLRDEALGLTLPESSIVIEHLTLHYAGGRPLLPADPDAALTTRLWDRFFDLHVSDPMQKIVGDRRRPPDGKDPHGVAQAKARLDTAYGILDAHLRAQTEQGRSWAAGDSFSMADCAAAPALFYADKVQPFGSRHANVTAYFSRLRQRPSYARPLKEAEPYLHLFPRE
jgi:glutathione S-transferase